ncbi:lipid-transfer protein [Spongiibacter nanhainus]|uniref:propanoyl-CoA C-acyltransferase n=1 Tax=Spongiibacter nanhainus TaxID=2794344 RepID=A0A7T4R188_9GAMM|nr:lipid-transfer protein [Spongiibacter nanhainus]QQD18469.1 lipid-transfer protein [Spongiibacter nanhainus]
MTLIAGVGMVPFKKPGASATYIEMGCEAARAALQDACVSYDSVQQAIVGYVYGDSTSGQAAMYRVGMTGIPIVNVNNNCSTGSSALFIARQLIESGVADCILVLGFEQMTSGALQSYWNDRPNPMVRFEDTADRLFPGSRDVPSAIRLFGGAGKAYLEKFDANAALFAKVRAKASKHASMNPLAVFRQIMTEEEVMMAPEICPGAGLTRLMACPPTCGAAAALLVSEDFAQKNGIKPAVTIRAQAMTTDTASTFESGSMMDLVGYSMSRAAAQQVYESAGIGPDAVDVCELHDCFAPNEVLAYEALGLCAEGDASRFVSDGDNTYGGRCVTNPSGGLLSKGHPLGATGLAQCYELVQQLRGSAEQRQVANARLALQHNIGLGGAAVVTLYERV